MIHSAVASLVGRAYSRAVLERGAGKRLARTLAPPCAAIVLLSRLVRIANIEPGWILFSMDGNFIQDLLNFCFRLPLPFGLGARGIENEPRNVVLPRFRIRSDPMLAEAGFAPCGKVGERHAVFSAAAYIEDRA